MKIIETERLILRDWRLSDSSDLYEYAQSELVGSMAGWQAHASENESLEIIGKFIEAKDTFALVLKNENKVVGSIGLYHKSPNIHYCALNQYEIGYVLNPAFWGCGLMSEAVKVVIKFAFEELSADIIWCCCDELNLQSKRVIAKCGFNFQHIIEKALPDLGDEIRTTLCYNIHAADYK